MKRMSVLSLFAACLCLTLGGALAAEHSQTSTYDPTPKSPKSGDECTITFTSSGDSAQNKADVAATKKAFDEAMKGSADMREKVEDACSKKSNSLTVNVKRDDKDQSVASTPQDGTMGVDLGDIEKLEEHMTGKAQDKTKLAAKLLLSILAHEIDHNRNSATDGRKDPASDKGTTGKPVDDENKVLKDLKAGITRNQYVYKDTDGKWKISFTVDKQKVVLNLTDFLKARSTAQKYVSPQEQIVDPLEVLDLPDGPCSLGGTPCFEDLLAGSPPDFFGDFDLDGVDDFDATGPLDNAPGLSNPQQADTDLDGIGQGLDPDDDADGRHSWFENVTSSSDMDVTSQPESWFDPTTCNNLADDDGDGIVDAGDQSCHVPPPHFDFFPGSVPVNDVYPDWVRRDLGSMPEGVDLFRVTWNVSVEIETIVENWVLTGAMVVVREEPSDNDFDTLREIRTEIVHLDLEGFSPTFGPIRLGGNAELPSPGVTEDDDLGSPLDFPAESFFDVFFELDLPPLPPLTNLLPDGYSSVVGQWPPYGHVYGRVNFGPNTLTDPAGLPVGQILGGDFMVEIVDSDVDGIPDWEDLCPFHPGPEPDDADGDGVGNPCDSCPLDFNPEQADLDRDGIGDPCDDDVDGDGVPNPLDCAPEDRLTAVLPGEVPGVSVTREEEVTTVTWQDHGDPAFRMAYDVLSGSVADLHAQEAYNVVGLECAANTSWSEYWNDPRPDPGPGEALFYLVRARNACGQGSWGDSGQLPDPRDDLDIPGDVPCD